MAPSSAQARRHLDSRFARLQPLAGEPRPHRGWIRAIRDALGMSGRELGTRLEVSQSTIDDLERSEVSGTIKLETLRRAADSLDCDLVYALLPRTTLEETVRRQARLKAAQHLQNVTHHTRLEDQAVATEDADAQLDELAARFIDRRGLWTDATTL